uniref:Uncharacterized protein LOC105140861 n=1 Tax=Rhizophora mucronata TaxID=61149 RepID=A0A2P2JT64_RHIMU
MMANTRPVVLIHIPATNVRVLGPSISSSQCQIVCPCKRISEILQLQWQSCCWFGQTQNIINCSIQ